MPKLQIGRYAIVVWPKDHGPPHVHVLASGGKVKVFLGNFGLQNPKGFSAKTLRDIEKIVRANHETLMEMWEKIHGKNESAK